MLTLRILVSLAVLGLGTLLLSEPARAQQAPPPGGGAGGGEARVTTDTPEYCESLADRVARAERARPNAPRAAGELAEEGHHMCATGLIRAG